MNREPALPSPSLVLSLIALALACAGGATAAAVIDGAEIKKGTVRSKQVHNRTLKLADLKPATVSALQGAPTAETPTDPSPTEVYETSATASLPLGSATRVLSLALPAGSYVLAGQVMVLNPEGGNTEPQCTLAAAGASIRARSSLSPFARDTLPVNLATSSAEPFTATVTCEQAGNENAEDRVLTATKVDAIR